MKSLRPHTAAVLGLAVASLILPRATAEEGGAGHHVPGGKSTLIDLLPTQPGWVLESMYMHYDGDVSASTDIPVGGLITLGLDATSDAFMAGGFYTFEQQVLGAYYSIGGFVPYVWVDVEARLSAGSGGGSRSDSTDGFGDISFLPLMMAWQLDCWQIDASLPIYAPTGDYDAGRLANAGLNHWTFDPTVGAAYSNERTGFNFASHAGFAFSTENDDTDYTNGTVLHLDASVQQLLPVGRGFLGLGVEAFYYDQISGDDGSGATLGDFEGRTAGIGPVLSYILPMGENNLVAEARWLHEVDTAKRLEGDYFWFKLVYQF